MIECTHQLGKDERESACNAEDERNTYQKDFPVDSFFDRIYGTQILNSELQFGPRTKEERGSEKLLGSLT
jgi:hypothetical protein